MAAAPGAMRLARLFNIIGGELNAPAEAGKKRAESEYGC
jgi:hypothetical protein